MLPEGTRGGARCCNKCCTYGKSHVVVQDAVINAVLMASLLRAISTVFITASCN